MGFQDAYNQYPAVGAAGSPVDATPQSAESAAAEGAIGFGLALIAGTDPDKQVKLPAAAGGVFRGISRRTELEQDTSGGSGYPDKSAVNVGRRGKYWVPVTAAVARDTPAYFVNSGADKGKFNGTDDGTTDAVPTGVFRSSTTGAGLAQLEINLV